MVHVYDLVHLRAHWQVSGERNVVICFNILQVLTIARHGGQGSAAESRDGKDGSAIKLEPVAVGVYQHLLFGP